MLRATIVQISPCSDPTNDVRRPHGYNRFFNQWCTKETLLSSQFCAQTARPSRAALYEQHITHIHKCLCIDTVVDVTVESNPPKGGKGDILGGFSRE